jgi:cobalt-zinc-cadmium efflux system outer membrane protein
MRVITIMGVVVLGVTPVVCAQSQDRPQSPVPNYLDAAAGLTLDEAIARALEHEPSLQAARTDVDAARGMRIQAGLRPNPSASFSQQNEPGGTDSQTRVEVQWPLDLFRKAGRAAVADREIDAARQATADREWALAGDVRLKYGEVVAAVRALEVADEVISATGRQLSLVSNRVAEGGIPPLDRDILRVEAQRLAADRILQAGQAERAFIELKRLIGLPAEAPLRLRDPLEQLVQREADRPLPGDAAAAMTRPDVLEAGARVDLAGAQIDRARREGRPDVSLFGMYMRMDAGFSQRGINALGDLERVRGVFRYFSAGAMVVLPLQNRNQGEVAAGRARQQGAEARLRAARLTAASEIAAARVRDVRARQALAAYAPDTRTLARHNLDVVRQTYELGRVTLFDVLNEQRRYLDTERAYTDTLREAYEAREGLMQALGEFR